MTTCEHDRLRLGNRWLGHHWAPPPGCPDWSDGVRGSTGMEIFSPRRRADGRSVGVFSKWFSGQEFGARRRCPRRLQGLSPLSPCAIKTSRSCPARWPGGFVVVVVEGGEALADAAERQLQEVPAGRHVRVRVGRGRLAVARSPAQQVVEPGQHARRHVQVDGDVRDPLVDQLAPARRSPRPSAP